MGLMPDDACERLLEGCASIGRAAEAARAGQWEIVATQAYGLSVDIERGRISLAGGGGEGGYGIRIVDDGRFGFAYIQDTSEAEAAVAQAIDIATKSPRIEGFGLQADSGSTNVDGLFDRRIDELTADDLITSADELISDVAGIEDRAVVTGGGVSAVISAGAMQTSEGIEDSGVRSRHGLGVQLTIDQDDLLTSGWQGESERTLISDSSGMIEEALFWTTETRNPCESDISVSESPMVLTDCAVGGLFSTIVPQATLGDRQARGESFWSGRIGEVVLDEHLSLTDDRTMAGGMDSAGRDGEGMRTRANQIVSDGRLEMALWSTRDAVEQVSLGNVEAAVSTGSASRDGHDGPPYPASGNLLLTSKRKARTRQQLVEDLDTGFLIGGVMGAHTANPTSGDFSVTTSHIIRVEDGEMVGALRQAGLSGNLPQAFTAEVALGDSPTPHGGWSGGPSYLPDIRFGQGIRVNPA